MRKLVKNLLLLGLMSLLPIAALGQAISGDIVGAVRDSSGAVVANATVEATHIATNVKTTTTTNSAGEFHFINLPAGRYSIQASTAGLKGGTEIDLKLNQTATANITTSVSGASTTVEVSGAVAAIDTTTPQIQNTFDSKTIADSPATSTGSGVINLSLLNAGVASSGGIGLGAGPSVSGQRPRNNNFTVEGVDNNSKSVTGPLLQLPNDTVDQFTVLQNQFSPEFGHSSGGQFNQTIKSGSNAFHGRLYEYFQNRDLNAEDSLTAASQVATGIKPFVPRYDNNRFGGQIGGPIIKNKLFFFANWEYNPVGQVTSSTGCGPTAAGYATLAGLAPAIDPITMTMLSVSQTNISQLQKYAGVAPNQAGPTDANCESSTPVLNANIPIGDIGYGGANYNNNLTGVVSIDYNISTKDQLRGRYAYENFNGLDINGQVPTFWQTSPSKYNLFTLSEYHNFSSNINNEFRFGYNRNASTTPAGNFQFPGLGTFPNIIIFGAGAGIQVGPDPNAPQFGAQNMYQGVDNLSWVKGKHNFKFGAEYREYIAPQSFTQRVRGDYDWTTWDGYFTDQVPDYLAERSIGDTIYYGNQNAWYFYGNDEWRVTRNFTINAGLRYEYTQVPLSERQFQPLNAISSVPGLINFSAPQAQGTNFLPRVGFAWSPGSSGNTSIRGGFGMAVDVLYDNLGLLTLPPQLQQTCDASPGQNPPMNSSSCFWQDPTVTGTGFLAGGGLPFSATVPPITSAAAARLLTGSYTPNQQLPYSETVNLGIQHVFAQKYTLEVRYVGTRGIHLPVQTRLNRQAKTSADMFLPTYLTAPTQAQLDALPITLDMIKANPNYVPAYADAGFDGNNIVSFQPYGGSKYNGLQTQLTRSFTNGLQFQFAWTWSHAFDNSTADVFSTYLTPRRPQDFQDFNNDWSTSALDRRHRVTMAVLYDVPFFKTSSSWMMKNVVGNWQFTPQYTFQSPEYATVQSGIDTNLNGDSAGDRAIYNPLGVPNTGSNVTPLTNSSGAVVAYLANNSTAQYIVAGSGAMANIPRNTLAMPRINNFDMALTKRINITERQSVEFSAQAQNAFNHAQYVPGYISDVAPIGYTGSNVHDILVPSSSSFDNPASVFTNHPRTMVLVLKYNF